MTDLSLRPRSATELVDAAFQVFRRDPAQFMLAAALVYVPWLLVRLTLEPSIVGGRPEPGRVIIGAAMSVFVYAIASGVITLLAQDVYFDRQPDLPAAFRIVGRTMAPLLFVSLITFVYLIAGAVLLLLPMFYVLARFFAVRQVVVIENAGVNQALSRSSELTVGAKGHVLRTLLLAGALTLAVSFGAGLLMSIIPSVVVAFVVAAVLSVIIYPFLAITETLLYYDMRIRKEGFDVEYLARGGPPADSISGSAA